MCDGAALALFYTCPYFSTDLVKSFYFSKIFVDILCVMGPSALWPTFAATLIVNSQQMQIYSWCCCFSPVLYPPNSQEELITSIATSLFEMDCRNTLPLSQVFLSGRSPSWAADTPSAQPQDAQPGKKQVIGQWSTDDPDVSVHVASTQESWMTMTTPWLPAHWFIRVVFSFLISRIRIDNIFISRILIWSEAVIEIQMCTIF